MNDEEWEKRRQLAIAATFRTGRSVFADSEGVLRYTDGDREPIADEGDAGRKPSSAAPTYPKFMRADQGGGGQDPSAVPTPYTRALRATRVVFVASIVGASLSAIAGFWQSRYFLCTAVMISSALVWHRVRRIQRKLYGIHR